MKPFGIVYLVINKVNNKTYVGQTVKSLSVRKASHKHAAFYKRKHNSNNKFYNAIRKHGWDNFEWYILDSASNIDDLNMLEMHYIDKFQSYYEGYNSTFGGGHELGKKMPKWTPERKAQHILKQTGRVCSEESKRLMSENNPMRGKFGADHPKFGKAMPDSAKQAISKSMAGINHPFYGKKASKETIEKRVSKLRKPIVCLETNEVFKSIAECSRKTGAQMASLIRHLQKHKAYRTVLGRHYEFVK